MTVLSRSPRPVGWREWVRIENLRRNLPADGEEFCWNALMSKEVYSDFKWPRHAAQDPIDGDTDQYDDDRDNTGNLFL